MSALKWPAIQYNCMILYCSLRSTHDAYRVMSELFSPYSPRSCGHMWVQTRLTGFMLCIMQGQKKAFPTIRAILKCWESRNDGQVGPLRRPTCKYECYQISVLVYKNAVLHASRPSDFNTCFVADTESCPRYYKMYHQVAQVPISFKCKSLGRFIGIRSCWAVL